MRTVAIRADARREHRDGASVAAARSRRRLPLGHVLGTVLVLGWTLPPFLYLVVLSVKPEGLIAVRSALLFWPTFDRYRELIITHLGLPIWNSLLTSTAGA